MYEAVMLQRNACSYARLEKRTEEGPEGMPQMVTRVTSPC